MAGERRSWDGIFSRLDEGAGGDDDWLERWRETFEARPGSPVLDLGCGAGYETQTLTRWGHPVIAADFSTKALEITRRRAPGVETREVDLARPLPFPDAHFGAVVASLSLHYFPWHQTERILKEIHRCLVPGGHLIARLNSTKDAHYVAKSKQEIEPNYYLVDGHPKRLFDRHDVDALFPTPWTLEQATELTTTRYGGEKTLWEVVAHT